MSKAYLYSPEGLAENFRKLKQEEDELVKTLDNDDNDRITRTSDQQEDNYIVAAVQLTGREFEKDQVRGFLNLAMHAVGEAAKKGANVICQKGRCNVSAYPSPHRLRQPRQQN